MIELLTTVMIYALIVFLCFVWAGIVIAASVSVSPYGMSEKAGAVVMVFGGPVVWIYYAAFWSIRLTYLSFVYVFRKIK